MAGPAGGSVGRAPRPVAASRSGLSEKALEALTAYLFLLPSLGLFAVWVAYPVLYSLYLSFHRWNFMGPKIPVGLGNYAQFFTSADAWNAVRNTVLYVAGTVPGEILLGLLFALAIQSLRGGRDFFRALFFTPMISSTVAVAMVWVWIFNPQLGLLNQLLALVGLPPQPWLSSPDQALLGVMIMSVWQTAGYNVILFLAGLNQIPGEVYDAGKIDGATGWRVFRYITWPLLSPTTFFILIISVINSFRVFTQVHVMTDGGPLKATQVVVYLIYQEAFRFFNMGYASAIAYLLFLFVLGLTVLQMKYVGQRVHYQ